MTCTVQTLPLVTVQPDFDQVLDDVRHDRSAGEEVWVSCYNKDTGVSVHGNARLFKHDGAVKVTGHSIDAQLDAQNVLCVTCSTTGADAVRVHAAAATSATSGLIATTMDVAPGGQTYVLGGCGRGANEAAQLCVKRVADAAYQLPLHGHVADVTLTLQRLVVLSGSADLQLRIWSAVDGSNPVVLKGHSAAITSLAIVGRAASRDGTVKLWECGSATEIATIARFAGPVNAITLTADFDTHGSASCDTRESETKGKLLVCAVSDGTLHAIDLYTREKVFELDGGFGAASKTACAISLPRQLLASGDERGGVQVFDIASKRLLASFRRNDAAITDVQFEISTETLHLWVTTADGQCYRVVLETDDEKDTMTVRLIDELVGPSLEAIVGLHLLRTNAHLCAYVAGADGVVRQYHIPLAP
ncbi:quinon protein alcohol dehydrogenase-like superfamily [Thamnocephalis sphaerospora]|uniref:Quinon protein alcohol dehydrogenase-like superfamily n=1 Tax=Thamnocephalis sphaerospora TaxID=78915 RepID=A0A4P9XLM5_9FUNG|nr:quinon protein alcohol dehydrogenase-like superfamily [Thamnocephalis sphaerospora]|eukprot:RKP06777.1 quinon protein alcohol dehydrogenase-like superfamily [Thamnocephalis sphaerospora]